MPRKKLRDYQQNIGIEYCKKALHPALFWEMRVGKNLVCLRACKFWDCIRNLIVAPYETFNAWIDELNFEGETDIIILDGTRENRLKKLFNKNKWFLINREGWRILSEIKSIPWDTLIYDESYDLHNPRSKTSKFFVRNFRNVKHRFALSGLPDPESRLDYVQQLLFVNENIFMDMKIKNYWDFRAKMCKPGHFKWKLTKKGEKYLQQKIAEYASILTQKDIKMHGEKNYHTVYVPQTPEFYNTQEVLIDEMVFELKGKEIKSTINAPNAFLWLHQLCGGFSQEKLIYKSKLRSIKKYIEKYLGNKQFVICAWYKNEIITLSQLLESMNISHGIISGSIKPIARRKHEKDLKSGKIRSCIINPACFAYGANISMVDYMLLYSSPASLNKRKQVECRIVDVTQIDSANIIEFLVVDSIDIDISKSIRNKENASQLFQRITKRFS